MVQWLPLRPNNDFIDGDRADIEEMNRWLSSQHGLRLIRKFHPLAPRLNSLRPLLAPIEGFSNQENAAPQKRGRRVPISPLLSVGENNGVNDGPSSRYLLQEFVS